ncbi:WcbI family polysaccharide biosynthesis putative acetyltransferase [Nocardioides pelophilus]|uniref:WcbI family polysaccharide biosynthesis putative acetyltransferase n=1 Tax=Nocardioides pelophilus TaxID=2172019 RepID=UPI0015FF677A|nr:WcbI family polysaccharide biosynthesis putative acetyltransferase [Nocardioides pelophilus]
MAHKVRIGMLGNCQAGPLSQILQATLPDVVVERVVTVHLAKDEDRAEAHETFRDCDLILAQRVADNYPCTFVRNNELKGAFGSKVIVWPNLYYRGYNPELVYVKDAVTGGPLPSPLGNFHSRTVHDAWVEGVPATEAAERHSSIDFNRERYARVPDESLKELREREADCDVVISDWVAEHRWDRQIFFTFNHPTRAALAELVRRVIDSSGLLHDGLTHEVSVSGPPEPLGRYRLPLNPWIHHDLATGLESVPTFQGNEVAFIDGVPQAEKAVAHLPLSSFVETSYRVYDAHFGS